MDYREKYNLQRNALLVPGVLLYRLFNFLPLLALLYMSLISWPGIGPWKFVGFENFSLLFTNDYHRTELLRALSHNITFFAITITLMLGLGTLLALLLSFGTIGRAHYRTIFFLAYPMAGAAVAFLLQLTFDTRGPINALLTDILGWRERPIPFLGDKNTALPTLAIFYSWHRMGFAIILVLSAIVSVRVSLLEAAFIDGASRLQAIRAVIFPVLAPAFMLISVIVMVDVFNNADYTLLLMGAEAGPNRATDVMGSFLYRTSFGGSATSTRSDMGLAAAIGLITAVMILPLALVMTLRNMRK